GEIHIGEVFRPTVIGLPVGVVANACTKFTGVKLCHRIEGICRRDAHEMSKPTGLTKAEKGSGWAGPFKRDGFGAMNRDRVPRWRKSASGSYRQSRPRATNLMPMQARSTPTL
ncbi:MAG TPA: hypothetical protein VNY04_01580, partial [Chthoniobacterales bacterium]|nr:hypothetical protein [Chthoniobacterales bacterium]